MRYRQLFVELCPKFVRSRLSIYRSEDESTWSYAKTSRLLHRVSVRHRRRTPTALGGTSGLLSEAEVALPNEITQKGLTKQAVVALLANAREGDVGAYRGLANRVEGKAHQSMDVKADLYSELAERLQTRKNMIDFHDSSRTNVEESLSPPVPYGKRVKVEVGGLLVCAAKVPRLYFLPA